MPRRARRPSRSWSSDGGGDEGPDLTSVPGSGAIRRTLVSAVAVLVVLVALLLPNDVGRLSVAGFASLPVEVVLAAALLLLLPFRARPALAATLGVVLGLLTVVKIV